MEIEFYDTLHHPMRKNINEFLNNLGITVWGNWVGKTETMNDVNKDPYFTQMGINRLASDELDWIYDQVSHELDIKWDGEIPQLKSSQDNIVYENTEFFPVDEDTMKLVNLYLNSFDAFVIGTHVLIASHFQKHHDFVYHYQLVY